MINKDIQTSIEIEQSNGTNDGTVVSSSDAVTSTLFVCCLGILNNYYDEIRRNSRMIRNSHIANDQASLSLALLSVSSLPQTAKARG